MNMESTQSRAAQMGRGELLYNEVKSADEIMERVRAVTLEEVRTLAEEFCTLTISPSPPPAV